MRSAIRGHQRSSGEDHLGRAEDRQHFAPGELPHLMRSAISGHQRSPVVIRGHQRPSEVIRGHQRSSEVI